MTSVTFPVQRETSHQSSQKVSDLHMFDKQDSKVLKFIVKFLHNKKLSLVAQLILLIFHVSGLIYTTYEKCVNFFEPYSVPLIIVSIDVVCSVWVVLTNIVGIVKIANDPAVPELLMYFYKHRYKKTKYCKVFRGYLIIMHTINLLVIILKIYVGLFYFDWRPYLYILAEDVEYYLFTLTFSVILYFAEKIKIQFLILNENLLQLSKEYTRGELLTFDATKNLACLRCIVIKHNGLCDQLDKFNESFKCILLFTVINITQNLLWNFMIFIVTVSDKVMLGDTDIKVYIIIMLVINMIVTASQAALVALVGEHLAVEGQQTTKLCYSLLNKLPIQLQTETEQLVEKQLQFLLDQSKSRNVSLHAGGFFQLNWGILGSIATTVTTYSIVLIQFLLK